MPEIITDATEEPISLEMAYAHLRIDPEGSPPSSPHDFWLENIGIPGSRSLVESFTGLSLAPKTLMMTIDAFPDGSVRLDGGPVTEILSVMYLTADGDEVAMDPSSYMLDNATTVGWLSPSYGGAWPATAIAINTIRIRYVAGYTAQKLPAGLRAGILLTLGEWFKNREWSMDKTNSQLPLNVQWVLRPHRILLGMA